MAKEHSYKLRMIREGRNQDYYDFWDRNLKENANGEELTDGLVGFVIMVDAATLEKAIDKASEKYPKATVCRKYSLKVG